MIFPEKFDKMLSEDVPFYMKEFFPVNKHLKPFYVKDIMSWSELEKLINLRPLMSNSRFQCSEDKNFTWPNRSWLSDVNTYPPQTVKAMMKLGTCYITDCSRVNKTINSMCKYIEDSTGSATDAHIYFSQVKDKSFGVHCDSSANFIVQCEGETYFKVWDIKGSPGEEYDMEARLGVPKPEPLIDVLMNPGDIVFIHSLMYHQAVSKTNRVSVSFPIDMLNKKPEYIQERDWIRLCTN